MIKKILIFLITIFLSIKKSRSSHDLLRPKSQQDDFHIPNVGDIAVSKALRELLEQGKDINREFTAHFKIDNGMIVQGSFRKDNGHCPDILWVLTS